VDGRRAGKGKVPGGEEGSLGMGSWRFCVCGVMGGEVRKVVGGTVVGWAERGGGRDGTGRGGREVGWGRGGVGLFCKDRGGGGGGRVEIGDCLEGVGEDIW